MPHRPPTDDALERMLRDFFAREMPPELRALPDRPSPGDGPLRRSAPAKGRPARRVIAGLIAAGLVACGVLFAVVASRPEPIDAARPLVDGVPVASPDSGDVPAVPAVSDEPVAAPVVERRSPVVAARPDELDAGPLFVVESVEPLERRTVVTPRGPVEQRTDLHWTNVGLVDEETGTRTEYAVPSEVTIEILPLDGEPAAPRTTPRGPADPRLPEERGRDR